MLLAVSDPSTPKDLPVRRALGQEIRRLRQLKKIGQEGFADQAGIHRNHIGLLERGELDPRLSTLLAVANALEIGLDQLLAQTFEQSPPQPEPQE
jgi:transcriptional regulator with XRE-family HTH domain